MKDSVWTVFRVRRCRRGWRILGWIGLVLGMVVLLGGAYGLWFHMGRPRPMTDYVALLNQMSRFEGQDEADNAWPDYEKAAELLTWNVHDANLAGIWDGPLRRFADLDDPEKRAVQAWVWRNEEAWQTFVQGTNKPYCRREYRPLTPNELEDAVVTSEAPMMRINAGVSMECRRLYLLGSWRIQTQLALGHTQAAVEDCMALIRAGTHWSESKLLVPSLMGLGFIWTGCHELLAVIEQGYTSDIDWDGLAHQLRDFAPDPQRIIDLRAARLEFLDVVQHSFTRGGIGGGHLIPRSVWPLVCSRSLVITMRPLAKRPTWRQRAVHGTIALLHARRNATVSMYESLTEQANRIVAMTPYQVQASGLHLPIESPRIFNNRIGFDAFVTQSRYFVIGVLPHLEAAERLGEMIHQLRTLHEATLTVLAIRRYQVDRGRLCETLEELVQAGYLGYVPLDPYSDKPLVYRRTEGGFLLYSLGRNMTDDGGAAVSFGERRAWWGTADKGDAILWPPQ